MVGLAGLALSACVGGESGVSTIDQVQASTSTSPVESETPAAQPGPSSTQSIDRAAATSGTGTPSYGSAVVDGNPGEWSGADFFADMFRAGKEEKDVLSKLYVRYACATETLYVYVDAEPNWLIINEADDNFVKIDGSKLVDGDFGNDGVPPDFEYVAVQGSNSEGWEASGRLGPGSYSMNVHAQVEPIGTRSETSAVADRAIPLEIDCSGVTTTTAPATTSTTGESTTTTAGETTTTGESTTTSSEVSPTSEATSTTMPESTTSSDQVGSTSLATTTTVAETLPNTGPGLPAATPLAVLAVGLFTLLTGALIVASVSDR